MSEEKWLTVDEFAEVLMQEDPQNAFSLYCEMVSEKESTDGEVREHHEIPSEVVSFDDDVFKKICNELGRQGVLDQPNKTKHLTIEIDAGELVVVTEVE